MALSDFGEYIAYEAAFSMQVIDDPLLPIDALANVSDALATKLRALAAIALLVNADSDGYFHNLIRAGITRVVFLTRLRSEGITSHHHDVSGRFDAVIDFAAAAQFDKLADLRALTPTEWREGHEYEDDYCYAQLLFRLGEAGSVAADFDSIAYRFSEAIDGAIDARLDACRAIAHLDQKAFDAAFDDVLRRRQAAIESDKARGQTMTPEIAALRAIYVEGLALLQLATHRGLQTANEYAQCPSIARVVMRRPFLE